MWLNPQLDDFLWFTVDNYKLQNMIYEKNKRASSLSTWAKVK